MVEIVWQDPPTPRQRPGEYDEVIAVLKKNPGRWALISKDWRTNSAPSVFKQKGCQTSNRKNAAGKSWSLYVRFPASNNVPAPKPDEGKAKVREAIQTGTALTPPPASPRRPAPAPVPPEPTGPVNDFGMTAFRAARAARGVPPEGKH